MSFAKLKRSRGNLQKLAEAAQAASSPKGKGGDDRYWKISRNKDGNGYAVIRFLPAAEGAELPWVQYWDHGFQGPTGLWYIEKSLTTLGQDDPVSEVNRALWNSGIEDDKEIARKQKRRLHYVANIYVVEDPSNPDNNGKVFLFRFGKKIFDKLMESMNPQFEDEEPLNPFDMWEGANFKLKIRTVEGYPNYDRSEFSGSAPLKDDDDELEAIYNSMHDLHELVAPSNFKTYDDLKSRLNKVLGKEEAPARTSKGRTIEDEKVDDVPAFDVGSRASTILEDDTDVGTILGDEGSTSSSGGDDDIEDYFAKLAAED